MKILKSKLRLFFMSFSIIGLATFFVVSVGYAAGVVSVESGSGDYHSSYGYNSDSYDNLGNWADNDTNTWQALGSSAGLNDWGVSWQTSNDGGSSWSTLGHEDLFVGQKVKFQFNMHSANEGIGHLANVLKGWIDWNTTVGFNSDQNYNGTYKFDNVVVTGSNVVRTSYGDASDETIGLDAGYRTDTVFTSGVFELDESHLGTAYLRARVTCTESIKSTMGLSGDQWAISTDTYESVFEAYKDYYQGEIEDWLINVKERPGGGDPVPEPATFALFGMGLIGLARLGRKKA